MTRRQRHAVLLSLIENLRRHGSWCGDTHVQKATYFLQEFLHVPLDFNVILYKHGPYSFELADELTALQADRLIALQPQEPYGPKLIPTDAVESFQARYPTTVEAYAPAVEFVARQLGPKNVKELERLATACYVRNAKPDAGPDELAAEVHRLKPHVSLADARAAVDAVEAMRMELFAAGSPA